MTVKTLNFGKNGILPLWKIGGWKLIRQFMVIFYHFLDGKFQVRFTLPLDSHGHYKGESITPIKAPYHLCNLHILFCYVIVWTFSILFIPNQPTSTVCESPNLGSPPCVAMTTPNPADASVPTSPEPADVMLRGSGDPEIDTLISLWLPEGKIDFEPYVDWRQSYMM